LYGVGICWRLPDGVWIWARFQMPLAVYAQMIVSGSRKA